VTALDDLFARTRTEGRAALIGYLPAGYPTVPAAIDALQAMVAGGVDAIEIGLPYSDPLLDGPTIQQAVESALASGVTTADVLRTVSEVAATGAPTLVMSYWNPIERYGVQRFADDLREAGGVGTITSDVTPDSAPSWLAAADSAGLDHVFLVAPSSTDQRLAMTTQACTGFVYVSAVMGVTGARTQVSSAAEQLVTRARAVTDKPLCVGLGVSTGDQAAAVARYADGVIVGSAFVQRVLDGERSGDRAAGVAAVHQLARELAEGVRAGR
jgi:tryptophan synthase alpha chain